MPQNRLAYLLLALLVCLSVTGCDDEDAPVDEDGDGVLAAEDCDDTDAASTTVAEDADCDGTLTAADCDDGDAALGASAEDADCDGTLTDADCDDGDAALGARAEDADCDGDGDLTDCGPTDPSIYTGAPEILDDTIDQDCDGGDDITCVGNYEVTADSAKEMSALEYCAVISGDLYIGDNDALTNVDGLASLTSVGGFLTISNNGALCEASVLALVAGWTISGSQTISNNSGACP